MDGSRSWGKPKISDEAKRTVAAIRASSYEFAYLTTPRQKLVLRATLISGLEEGWRLEAMARAVEVGFAADPVDELRTPAGEVAASLGEWARAVVQHELGPLWLAEDTKWMDRP
ncbi:MAG: hypothetical protein NVS4B13_01730 [Candidatus Elarobacter sp.]